MLANNQNFARQAIITTSNLTKSFGTLLALDQVSIAVAPGTVFGFLGPNGAGKTTAVRLLNGLLQPTAGEAFVLGHNVATESDKIRARCGVQTDTNLYEKLSAQDNLEMWGRLYGLGGSRLEARIVSLLAMFGLTEQRKTLVGTFSKGMKQKLAIARALIHDPEILFLDEPTAGLDPEASEDLLQYLRKFIADKKRTVFLCSHRLEEVEFLCEAIAIIHRGRTLASGAIADLRSQLWPELSFRVRFLELRMELLAVLVRLGYVAQRDDQNQSIKISLSNETEIARVVKLLVEAGAEILAVQEERPSLKDIYFALTPRENHEHSPD